MPYDQEKVSWPDGGHTPLGFFDGLPLADAQWYKGWRCNLLRDPAEVPRLQEELGLRKPFLEPTLFEQPLKYAGFVIEMFERQMVKFSVSDSTTSNLGIFFVKKKDGSSRIIFDTRICNLYFRPPSHTRLLSASAVAGIQCGEHETLYFSSGDFKNCFYVIGVPDDLIQYFTLPSRQASFL
eukprot:10416610-Karenia_brevis.AAC.1